MAPHCSTCCCQWPQISFETPGLPDDVKPHILSNEPPSASDLPMLREHMLSLDPYLTRLDTEMAALSVMQERLQKELDYRQANLDALRKERQALEKRQQSLSGALSPLRRLPLEILQEIFLWTLAHSGKPDYTWLNVFDRKDPLWTLRSVCRNWRAATLYPHLWTGLRISQTGLGNLSVIRNVLDRSGSLPLRIRFSWDESRQTVCFGGIVLHELVQHSERWQYVDLRCEARELTVSISALRGRLPKLEELNFTYGDDSTLSDFFEYVHPFEIAPSLTKASINRAVVKLDYSRLKSFTSKAFTPTAFEVLVSSPSLTDLADYYRGSIHNDGSSPNRTRYLHSRLNTLVLKQCAQLDMFALPNLEYLDAGAPYTSESSPSLPIITQFLHVSKCPLLTLSIANCDLSVGSMSELLQLVPRLRRLYINLNRMESALATSTDEALSVLINRLAERRSDKLSLVPELAYFGFASCSEHSWRFMDASIVDMICARPAMEGGYFLIHLTSQLPNLSDIDFAHLRALTNTGLDLRIVKLETGPYESAEKIVLI